MTYFFNRPASIWEESFPLGNGRIGLMPDGGIDKENIVMNEISLWSGSRQDADNPQAYYYLSAIRKLLFEGKNDQAQKLMYNTFICKGKGSGEGHGANVPYGSYQIFGNLLINYNYASTEEVKDYRRELSLENAVTTTTFKRGNTGYIREAFTSFGKDVGVIYLSANTDKSINFTAEMNRPENAFSEIKDDCLWLSGQLPDGVDTTANKGMKFASAVKVVLPKGGNVETKDNKITVKDASEAIILVSMATDYFGENCEEKALTLLNEASNTEYKQLKKEHIEKYSSLFNRCTLNLGYSGKENMPIDQRLKAFATDKNDPSLSALYFQFGRYLLISSTREGLLPPNLQGLWCNTIDTPWNGDYHLNINLQMNLWPAEVTNLSELHMPLIEWTKQQVPNGQKTAKAFYNANGWVMHILGNVWGFTAPGEHPSWGATNTSAAWLCEHLYMHYLYTMDKEYLRSVYPTMKEAARFFVDMLVPDPQTKYLVTAPTTSPENAFKMANGKTVSICAGSTMDNQIIRELFTNTIEASEILGEDAEFANILKDKLKRIKPTTIGKDGRIMEWMQEYEEVEPTHRHVSHLYGLHPGNEISITKTPELAEAAKKTLEVRGDESTGWSMAWKINFWARLLDGNHAYKLIGDLLKPCWDGNGGGTFPNLFCGHPPFQIDGNFGGCAGIAEMLIQSHDGYIHVLPAIPDMWKSGSFSGMTVRGGGEVSASWSNGAINEISLKAKTDNKFRIKLPKNSKDISIKKNKKAFSLPVVDGMIEVSLNKGDEVVWKFE